MIRLLKIARAVSIAWLVFSVFGFFAFWAAEIAYDPKGDCGECIFDGDFGNFVGLCFFMAVLSGIATFASWYWIDELDR